MSFLTRVHLSGRWARRRKTDPDHPRSLHRPAAVQSALRCLPFFWV